MNQFVFYRNQSILTDPGKYSSYYQDINPEIFNIRTVVQGLIIHFLENLFEYQIPLARLKQIDLQFVSSICATLIHDGAFSFVQPRHFDQRVIGCCRDFSILACSILRHAGVPARIRMGFVTYIDPHYYIDSTLIEYWHADENRWCMVDVRASDAYIDAHHLHIDFDLLDVPESKFITAGHAWKLIRQNKINSDIFSSSISGKHQLKGLWYVRDRLILDFAALNSVEMLLWDVWGLMFESQQIEKDEKQLQFIDHIAELTIHSDLHFDDIRRLYLNDQRLIVPDEILSVSPTGRRFINWKTRGQ